MPCVSCNVIHFAALPHLCMNILWHPQAKLNKNQWPAYTESELKLQFHKQFTSHTHVDRDGGTEKGSVIQRKREREMQNFLFEWNLPASSRKEQQKAAAAVQADKETKTEMEKKSERERIHCICWLHRRPKGKLQITFQQGNGKLCHGFCCCSNNLIQRRPTWPECVDIFMALSSA